MYYIPPHQNILKMFLSLLIFLLFSSSTYTYGHGDGHEYANSFSAVYAFGGSFTDTGNAYLMGRLKGNYAVTCHRSGGRLSNGRLAVDYVSAAISLPSPNPYLNATKNGNSQSGVNFAIAGSTSLSGKYFTNEEVTPVIWKGIPMSFQTQIHWFRNFLKEKNCLGKHAHRCKDEFKNALFWVGAMGISDFYTIQGSSVAQQWLTQLSIEEVTKLVETLINAGAKYIIVEGLPPIGCLPLSISACPSRTHDKMGCAATVNSGIMQHNQILQRKLGALRRHCRDCSILYADFWKAYVTVMTNPAKYQFEEPRKACCGSGKGDLNFDSASVCGSPTTSSCPDPTKYINWDGIHLTEAMHRQLADLYLNQGFCEPSFDKMIKTKNSI